MEKKITFAVKGKTISETCPLHWSSNTVDYIKAGFVLDDEWKSCDVVRAAWSGRQGTIITLLDADDFCVVPHEVLAVYGKVSVNLYGVKYDDDGEEFTRITTAPVTAIIIDSTARIDGSETAPITPSQFEQFVQAVKTETEKVTGMTAVAETLPAGSDATASYSDGVLTLGIPRGDKGDTGERGERGETGATGLKGDTGNGISSITKTGSSGLIDTYTITFTDGTKTTFDVTNGKDGSTGIDVDSELSSTSTNPVQNKAITTALNSKANTSSLASVATTGNYNDLGNKPTIPTVPTKVSAFTNDAGYITSVPSEYVTETEMTTAIAGKANTADLATVATSGSYADLTNKPTIPTVPTKVSAFTNDAHYITASGAPVQSVNGQTGNVQIDAMDIETLDDVAVNVASGNPVTISDATNNNAVKVTATLEPIQDLHGYDHPWAGGAGKNLFNYDDVESISNIENNNGTFTNTATDTRTYFAFTVQQYNGSTYVKGNNLNISASGRYSFPITVDSAITKLRIKHNGASKEFRFDFPFTKEGTFCVSVEVTSADPTVVGGVSFKDVMIESGSTMTAYEPYSNICPISGITNLEIANNGTTEVTVQLGQTVYGGTLDVTNGVLTVDKGYVDLGTLDWVSEAEFADCQFRVQFMRYGVKFGGNLICSILKGVPLRPYSGLKYGEIALSNTEAKPILRIRSLAFTDMSIADLQAFLDGQILVYELATPQTYQLTPAQIELLTGTNVITTNADNLFVKYYASGKGNVEGSLTLLAEELTDLQTALNTASESIAPAETGTATRNYAAGSYLMLNNRFCKVTAAIATGESIIVGSNVQYTTVAEELTAILAQINA